MPPTPYFLENQMRRLIVLAGIAFLLMNGLSLVEGMRAGEQLDGVAILVEFVDTAIWIAVIAMVAFVAIEGRDLARQRAGLIEGLAKAKAEGDHWRQAAQVHVQGLGEAISAQFRTWRLTSSEADIAMLLLKGLSHKDIAAARATSEATVRQQSRAIYQKSGLGSRAELAAFFLDDLKPPAATRTEPAIVTPLVPRDRR